MPWRELRRWRRQVAARRGRPLPPVMRARHPRRPARALPARWVRLARSAVLLVVALALAVLPLRPVLGVRNARELAARPAPDIEGAAGPRLEGWAVDLHSERAPTRPDTPPRPVAGQKRAPCVQGLEVEVSGYCWLPVKARPPQCPPQTVAYQGDCLLPLAKAQGPPVSVDGGQPEFPRTSH